MNNEYLVGKTILGYEIQELIGTGGFGNVYKGIKKVGRDTYFAAIKHISIPNNDEYKNILDSMGGDVTLVDKYFENTLNDIVEEINTLYSLSKIDNRNVVTYYDHEIIKNENPLRYDLFIRMEYLTPLSDYMSSKNRTVEDVINLGIDIAKALDNCHKQGIIHRDVKDGNIFISKEGNFKLGDFGIAKVLSDTSNALSMKGTPVFMAPEVVLGKAYNKTVDIYSLGIVMYRLLNYNRIPFLPYYPDIYTSKDMEYAMNKRLSGDRFNKPQHASLALENIILKACDKAENRYKKCSEFINDLIKVKDELDKEILSKLLFEACEDKKNKRKVQKDIDDTILVNKLDNTKSKKSNIFNKLISRINKKIKFKSLVYASTIIIIALPIMGIIFNNKVLMKDLPIESEGIGNLSSNYIPVFEDGTSRCSIVSGLYEGYNYQGEKTGIIEYDYDCPTTGYFLTEYFSVCLNRLGDEIYHIKRDTNEVKKVNIKTKEINDVYGIKAKQIITLGNYLYYTNASDENSGIYKVDLSNGKEETFVVGDISRFSINKDKILYQYNGISNLYMLDLNTKQINDLGINVSNGQFALYENCFMYIQDEVLYRSDIDIKKQQKIVSRVKEFSIDGKYLYYIDYKNNLYIADLSSGRVEDMEENMYSYLNVTSNMHHTSEEGYGMYIMDNIFE